MSAAAVDRELREYEMIYILRSSTNGEGAEKVLGRIQEVLDRLGGTMIKVDNWGRRKLAYPIAKSPRGVFVLIRFVAPNDVVAEIERNLGILDSVVRYQTIVLKRAVSLADYAVEEEELAFAPLEDEPDNEDPGLAQRLGLVERPKPPREGYGDYEGRSSNAPAADRSEGEAGAEAKAGAKPEAKPEAAEADAAKADTAKATTEAPKADAPKADAPKADAPKEEAE